jgi:hypothetical protein
LEYANNGQRVGACKLDPGTYELRGNMIYRIDDHDRVNSDVNDAYESAANKVRAALERLK